MTPTPRVGPPTPTGLVRSRPLCPADPLDQDSRTIHLGRTKGLSKEKRPRDPCQRAGRKTHPTGHLFSSEELERRSCSRENSITSKMAGSLQGSWMLLETLCGQMNYNVGSNLLPGRANSYLGTQTSPVGHGCA